MTTKEIGNRIKVRRKELHLTLQDVADQVRVARSTIQRYETGRISQMKMPVLYSIAQALQVSPDWLVGKSDSMLPAMPLPASAARSNAALMAAGAQLSPQEIALLTAYRKASAADRQIIDNIARRYITDPAAEAPAVKIIPLFGTSAAAGPGEPDTGLPWENYEVPQTSRAEFAVRISGDSMEPVLKDGEIALCRKTAPEVGDVAVFMVNGTLVVKQFITDGRNIYLRSLNRGRKDLDLDIWASGNDTVMCYGTVILKRRPALVDQ